MTLNSLFLAQLALFVLLLIMLAISFSRARRDKRQQNTVIDRRRAEIGNAGWKRIYVATPQYFRKKLKLLAYEGRGLLINHPDFVKIIVVVKGGTEMERCYAKQGLFLEWLGNPSIGSGNLYWIRLGQGEDQLMVSADTGFSAIPSREETADICRMIDQQFALPTSALADFALEKNPASLAVVISLFTLMMYAIIDGGIINDRKLINNDILPWIVMPALIFAIPCYFLLARNKVPARESHALAMFFTLALAVSAVPATKRLDQILAGSTSVSYEYKLLGNAKFEPLSAESPALSFPRFHEYWDQFDKGSIHTFEFIHGPFGLWQLDQASLKVKYKLFYEVVDQKTTR